MAYQNLESCIIDLERAGQLVRITEEVDPYIEMAAIHLRIHEAGGPALLFERVKGSRFRAVSNLFGTIERSRFIFRDTWQQVQSLIELKSDPIAALKHPIRNFKNGLAALKALPAKKTFPHHEFSEINIQDIPQIKHWPMDGGAFVTLPQVYTEDIERPGVANSNLGMYRIQLSGNDYVINREIGLHYQIHRGIGVHQAKANKAGQPLKVSVFVGGPPAHSVAAVMPLPEGLSEIRFAGVLGGRRFRYSYVDGYCISLDADFIITGEVYPSENKPEGPFGDHLGYYSLTHPFPLMRVHKVWARKNAIWPFTVVGRPPQEDTSFGNLIHELTGSAVQQEIPGLKEVNAVDAAGVHPLLLAIGSERYTPYLVNKRPAELLTIANHILGTGQLSLAKFLWITADDSNRLNTKDIPAFFRFVLERIDLTRDIHFFTQTTIDTLDYSGTGINSGSKVVLAAYGELKRTLTTEVPAELMTALAIYNPQIVLPGILALQASCFETYENAAAEIEQLNDSCRDLQSSLEGFPLMLICDDSSWISKELNNFLWTAFTRCNPSHDMYGIHSFTAHKHWGCHGPLIIDCRAKPHHAPVLEKDAAVEKKIDRFFDKGGSLFGVIK